MKLLDRKSIDERKSQERKREIDEGAKIARTVDSLRETQATEQEKLAKFRIESLKVISSEVEAKRSEGIELDRVNEVKRQERIKLEAPIDLTEEWKKVESWKVSLSERETDLISREIMVQDSDKRDKESKERQKNSELFLEEARKSYQKTDDIRSSMESRKKEFDEYIEKRRKELDSKEENLIEREFVIQRQVEQMSKEKNEVLSKGTALIERESNLESRSMGLDEREYNLKEKESLTSRYNDEASRNYDKSEKLNMESVNLKASVEADIKKKYEILSQREMDIGYRERDLILKMEKLDNDTKSIEKEKLHIASQQQTLKVAWDNIKKINKK